MIKGWRLFFYAVIAVAVLAIAYITVQFILEERLVKATGDPELEVRQRAARRIMGNAADSERKRKPAIEFLLKQPQTVRDNVIWAIEKLVIDQDGDPTEPVAWLVDIACDASGELPEGEGDTDTARLAVLRLGEVAVEPLLARLEETTDRTLERDTFAHRRAVAARLLGRVADQRATPHLLKALRDEYETVRLEAAGALVRLNDPAANDELQRYIEPLLGVLTGKYLCYVRVDSEGRLRQDPDRDDLVYGPFTVQVKPQEQATESDLARQRDSAQDIQIKEEARMAETRRRLEEGRRGQVIKTVKGQTDLAITEVTISREGATVVDPAGKSFELLEGEPMEVKVDIANGGPADLVTDFFVAVYGASPPPINHIDRPAEGEFAGERARDNRALAGKAEERHVRTLYHVDRPETADTDDRLTTVFVSLRFNTVEADRIEAIRQLMRIGHETAIEPLGDALQDELSYTVRRQAALALQRIMRAQQTSPAARAKITKLLRERGLTSDDAVVRCHAAEALRGTQDPAAIAALQALLLSDRDTTVRLVATRALADAPEVDREKMLPALLSADPGIRRMAPRLFSSANDAEIARRLLNDPDEAVAREVLRSAPRLLRTTDLLVALSLPDARARAQAARLLAARQDPAAKQALLRALRDSAGDVRAAAAAGLGALLRQSAEPDPTVISALVDVIKNEAGDYVGYPAGEAPEDPLTAVTTDKKSRAAAAEALARSDDPAAVAALTDALQDTSPDVITATLPAAARGTLGDQSERLIAIVEDEKMPARVREAGILAMWRSNTSSEEALDALVGLLNDTNEAIKTAAAVALIGLGDSRGDKVLRDQLRSKSADIKREAATFLAALPQERVDGIKGLKDDERDGLQLLIEELYLTGSLPVNFRFLVRSLVTLGEQPATLERMRAALTDPHPVLRAAGLTVLAQLGQPGTAETAVTMLEDRNEIARLAAVRACDILETHDAAPLLERLATEQPDPSRMVREAAAEVANRLD